MKMKNKKVPVGLSEWKQFREGEAVQTEENDAYGQRT